MKGLERSHGINALEDLGSDFGSDRELTWVQP